MDNLQQIVVQQTTAPYVRALAQYGESFIPESQTEIIYDELSDSEKQIWDDFVQLIKSK